MNHRDPKIVRPGLTLIEVLVALAIFALVSLVLVKLAGGQLSSTRNTYHRERALIHAQNMLATAHIHEWHTKEKSHEDAVGPYARQYACKKVTNKQLSEKIALIKETVTVTWPGVPQGKLTIVNFMAPKQESKKGATS